MPGRRFRGMDVDPGWINRKFRDIDTALRELRAEKRLGASSFAQVPAGAIPASALSEFSAPGYVYLTSNGFGVPVAGANVINSAVAVPAGFSRCVVTLTGRAFAYNSMAGVDYLYARPVVSGVTGNAVPIQTRD